MRLGIKAS